MNDLMCKMGILLIDRERNRIKSSIKVKQEDCFIFEKNSSSSTSSKKIFLQRSYLWPAREYNIVFGSNAATQMPRMFSFYFFLWVYLLRNFIIFHKNWHYFNLFLNKQKSFEAENKDACLYNLIIYLTRPIHWPK